MTGTIKPNHKALAVYYETLRAYGEQQVTHEGALETAFQRLLADTARARGWMLVPKQSMKRGGKTVIPDGTLRDEFNLAHGYWEAKDTDDDLTAEIRKKTARGYPLNNTIFEDTERAVLFQNGQPSFEADLRDPRQLADLLNAYYAHTEPDIEGFEEAVGEFKERVPELALALAEKIKQAHRDNAKFQTAFADFLALCRAALNPNLNEAAVDEMLVQHLLTERLIRKIFDNPEFTRRNVIAAEVEKVIAALVSKSFNRDEFLKSLDRFYRAIEHAARALEDFTEKQHFLNTVYERFFQGYSVKVADTHGIVYTPQAIVDFMCASVAEVLETEFGKSLGDKDVQILDPCTGTGNFIVNLLRRIPKKHLPRMYREQLFANEVMLLPYYIAALNIEHAYYELTGDYESFEGLCFVDTLDMAEGAQAHLAFMSAENTARVERQRKAPITVIIGNPPYNVGQLDENDNNKNREYPVIESRVRATYSKDSTASNKNALSDAYVKFFRWSTDRLEGRPGIVCLVSNNGFVNGIAFDGFRKHALAHFSRVYHFDLKGNARTTGERRRQEGGNIFSDQIRVGVGVTLLIRASKQLQSKVLYHAVPDFTDADQKKDYLRQFTSISEVAWAELEPDSKHNWLVPGCSDEFAHYISLGNKEAKGAKDANTPTVFKTYGRGVATCRDDVVYDFDRKRLAQRVGRFADDYNGEVDRYKRAGSPKGVDEFVRYDSIKWSRDLKLDLQRGNYATFSDAGIRLCMYRPFQKRFLFFDRILNEEVYVLPRMFPTPTQERENKAIALTDKGSEWRLAALCVSGLADLHFAGVGANSTQCFPFYVYSEEGDNRRENVTDWALEQFRSHYKNPKISKWDIFYYVYGLLHHAGYREKFADNLKRELPRIPLAPDFAAFSSAGKELARLHLEYESLDEWPLEWLETPGVPLSYRVEKMRLSKDKTALAVNPSLTLAGIPPETFRYRLGNRSALEWVIDQYQVSEDKRSGIRSDPNRPDDPQYITRLIGQVVRVSIETVRIVEGLPAFD